MMWVHPEGKKYPRKQLEQVKKEFRALLNADPPTSEQIMKNFLSKHHRVLPELAECFGEGAEDNKT